MEHNNKFYDLHLIKFELFKSQNPENGRFDVIFEIGRKILYAHRNMLTLVSDTFDSMLSDRWNPNKDEPIKIKDYSYNDFYQFLTFLYFGQCELTDGNIFAMVDMAEFYGVQLFKIYCDEYLSSMEITGENVFSLNELADKYSLVHLKAAFYDYITINFQSFVNSDQFLNLTKFSMDEIIISVKDEVKAEDLLQAIFKWAENQTLNKQSENPNLNFNDQFKTEISNFLHHIHFRRMDLHFLHEFVVPKSYIFSSIDELNKILGYCRSLKKVKITNKNGHTLHGNIMPDKTVVENIKSLKLLTCFYGYKNWCSWKTNFDLPSIPSPLTKRKGVKWYLFYYNDGDIGVKHCSYICENNYLLAELIPGPSGFETAAGCKILIE